MTIRELVASAYQNHSDTDDFARKNNFSLVAFDYRGPTKKPHQDEGIGLLTNRLNAARWFRNRGCGR